MNVVRVLVLCIGLLGSLLFAGAFAASWTSAHFISETAREVIRYRVAQEINEKVEALGGDFLLSKATEFFGRNKEEIEALKTTLKEGLAEQVVRIAEEMRDPDCACRNGISKALRDGLMSRIGDLDQMQDRLGELIQAKYLETEAQLTREFRIFTGTNALVSVLLVTATLVKRRAWLHLLPATVILLIASTITGYAYLFNQNWLLTILYGDYVGFAYLGYLAFVFLLLSDILLNRARVTARVLDGIFTSLNVGPC